jgi:5-methylcytosine-specific restriction endonuclease McrA
VLEQDFIDIMLPFMGTFVSAFFVLLFVAYLIFRNITERLKFEKLLDKVQSETRTQRDPWRVFKFAPKKRVMRRADNQCEWYSSDEVRCTITSDLQVDHIYPWAAGGWTLEDNAQVLCGGHHMIKGGLVPDAEFLQRIEAQRKTYFPEGVETKVRWEPTDEERELHAGTKNKLGPATEVTDPNSETA